MEEEKITDVEFKEVEPTPEVVEPTPEVVDTESKTSVEA